ncbi:MAG: hypothetical protein ACOC98_09195 [Thermodesulfobacteriota bacterium]
MDDYLGSPAMIVVWADAMIMAGALNAKSFLFRGGLVWKFRSLKDDQWPRKIWEAKGSSNVLILPDETPSPFETFHKTWTPQPVFDSSPLCRIVGICRSLCNFPINRGNV